MSLAGVVKFASVTVASESMYSVHTNAAIQMHKAWAVNIENKDRPQAEHRSCDGGTARSSGMPPHRLVTQEPGFVYLARFRQNP